MHKPIRLLLVLAALLAAGRPAAEEVLRGPVPAHVLRVIDGDTIEVRARIWLGQEVAIRVRLDGADAPELKGKCVAERERAQAARAFLEKRIGGREVTLTEVRYDKYGGRVLARVAGADGANVSDALIARGLAHAYGGAARAPWCVARAG